MMYTISKKLLIIASISSLLFLFGCNKNTQNTESTNTGETIEKNINTSTGSTQETAGNTEDSLSGEIQNDGSEKISPLLTDTGDIRSIIDEYKSKNSGKREKLNENDIDLMEKIIEKLDKK